MDDRSKTVKVFQSQYIRNTFDGELDHYWGAHIREFIVLGDAYELTYPDGTNLFFFTFKRDLSNF